MLTDAEAATIAVTVQALLTGAQFVTFLLCLRLHICPDDDLNTPFTRKNIRWPMLIITILIMAFGIVDLGCTLQTRLLGLKNDGDQLSTTIIAVRNPTVQGYRFPELSRLQMPRRLRWPLQSTVFWFMDLGSSTPLLMTIIRSIVVGWFITNAGKSRFFPFSYYYTTSRASLSAYI
jgi:hypothetical protein